MALGSTVQYTIAQTELAAYLVFTTGGPLFRVKQTADKHCEACLSLPSTVDSPIPYAVQPGLAPLTAGEVAIAQSLLLRAYYGSASCTVTCIRYVYVTFTRNG